jgi:hypothetical protein
MMGTGGMSMVCSRLVVTLIMMFGGFLVMLGSKTVLFGGFCMMLCEFFRHGYYLKNGWIARIGIRSTVSLLRELLGSEGGLDSWLAAEQ